MVSDSADAWGDADIALPVDYARLVRLCARLTGDAQAAEDLAQDTLVEAWRQCHKLREPAGGDAWLSAIARNVCLRWTAARRRDRAHIIAPRPGESAVVPDSVARVADTVDLIGAVGRRLPVARLIGLGAILFGLIDLAIWNAPTVAPAYALAVAIALFALVGLPGRGYLTGMTTLLQESVADAYRGRVFGAYATTSALAQLGGMALAGALGDRLGVLPLLNVQASVYLVAGVLALVLLRGATTGAPSAHEASEYEEEEGA